MHIRTWCYAVLCLFLPITLPAQKEHKYLDHALPEAWQENDSDFQQTLPVDDIVENKIDANLIKFPCRCKCRFLQRNIYLCEVNLG